MLFLFIEVTEEGVIHKVHFSLWTNVSYSYWILKMGRALKITEPELHPRQNMYLEETVERSRAAVPSEMHTFFQRDGPSPKEAHKIVQNCDSTKSRPPSPKELIIFQCFLSIPWNKCLFCCLLLKKRKNIWVLLIRLTRHLTVFLDLSIRL